MRCSATVPILLLAACGTTTSTVYTNPPPRTPEVRRPEAVELLTLPPAADRPYVEIGYVEIRETSEFSLSSRPEVINKLRVQGARMGCDAIVFADSNRVVGSIFTDRVHDLSGVRGTCLMYRDPAHALDPDPHRISARDSAARFTPECRPYMRAIFAAKLPEQRLAAAKATPRHCHRQ